MPSIIHCILLPSVNLRTFTHLPPPPLLPLIKAHDLWLGPTFTWFLLAALFSSVRKLTDPSHHPHKSRILTCPPGPSVRDRFTAVRADVLRGQRNPRHQTFMAAGRNRPANQAHSTTLEGWTPSAECLWLINSISICFLKSRRGW